jgi:hypothetical protein
MYAFMPLTAIRENILVWLSKRRGERFVRIMWQDAEGHLGKIVGHWFVAVGNKKFELCKRRSSRQIYHRSVSLGDAPLPLFCGRRSYGVIGTTTLSDDDLEELSKAAIANLIDGGGYNAVLRSCQEFNVLLLHKMGITNLAITTMPAKALACGTIIWCIAVATGYVYDLDR